MTPKSVPSRERGEILSKLAIWMLQNGYSEMSPVVINRDRFLHYEQALRHYFESPGEFGYCFKLIPSALHPLVVYSNLSINIKELVRVILPVQPGRPPTIINEFGPWDMGRLLSFFAFKEIQPYMVFTETAMEVLMNAVLDTLEDVAKNDLDKARTRAVLAWLESEEYQMMSRQYVK